MPGEIFNPNPVVFSALKATGRQSDILSRSLWINDSSQSEDDSDDVEPIDQDEIYGDKPLGVPLQAEHSSLDVHIDLIRSIYDPEHPNTLEELRVVSAPQVTVGKNRVKVEFTPTVPHCGMSTLIGLCIRVRLLRSLPERFKVDIFVKPGSHQSENAVNKQLNDKERVAAALENPVLLDTVEQCLSNVGSRGVI